MAMPKQKPGRSKQDYSTPPMFVKAVCELLDIDKFAVDLAASEHNAIRRSRRYFDEQTDSLAQQWRTQPGEWNWLNPPFADIEPWVRKAWESWKAHSARTAILIPASVGSNYWAEWINRRAYVLFLSPRLTFAGCSDPYPKDCALVLYGWTDYGQDHSYYDCWRWK